MIKVPYSRFRREFRKWLRCTEVVYITRNKVDVAVLVPTLIWESMHEQLRDSEEPIHGL